MPHVILITNAFDTIDPDIYVYHRSTGEGYIVKKGELSAPHEIQSNQEISLTILAYPGLTLLVDGKIEYPGDWQVTFDPQDALGTGQPTTPGNITIPSGTTFKWWVTFTLPVLSMALVDTPHNVTIGDPQGFLKIRSQSEIKK